MLSKAKIKYILSLQKKKVRIKEQAFVVEGEKIAAEVLNQNYFKVHSIYATEIWINNNKTIANQYKTKLTTILPKELKKISTLKSPKEILLIIKTPNNTPLVKNIQNSFNLVLENIQDPGNLGTIIRIADWFGIPNIFCSEGCVDVYNSKVIQASMGSFLRVKIQYVPIEKLFLRNPSMTIYGAVLGGQNVNKTDLKDTGFLLIGNEGKGLSKNIQKHINHPITIPKTGSAESLNAAVATGILCAFFKL
ncbi:MAG: RNA methyltransferase [Saprospiraceae bacterium]|nr:RNA methyltransferase [Saprospiraceae bacterium]